VDFIVGWIRCTKVDVKRKEFGMISVHDLRRVGYKVRVLHNRKYVKGSMSCEYCPRGGSTEITVFDPVRQFGFVGTARCNECDNYNRKVGVRIALSRALFIMGGYDEVGQK
jgi:hypothetical protein